MVSVIHVFSLLQQKMWGKDVENSIYIKKWCLQQPTNGVKWNDGTHYIVVVVRKHLIKRFFAYMLRTIQMIGRFLNSIAQFCGRFHVNFANGCEMMNIIQADCIIYDGINSSPVKIKFSSKNNVKKYWFHFYSFHLEYYF